MNAFLIDADNFSSPAWIDEAFALLEREEGAIAIRRAYGSAENLKGLADTLRAWAIRPFVNLPLAKNTTDLSLAVDAMELACASPRPKLVVIGSGDLDFVPLVVRLRERGIRVVCVSERSKMAQDAVRAYDQILYVGASQPAARRAQSRSSRVAAPAPAAREAAAREPAETAPAHTPRAPRKSAAKTPGRTAAKVASTTATAPALQPAAKPTPARPANRRVGRSAAVSPATTSPATASPEDAAVAQILEAAPNLRTGQWQALGEIAKVLHDRKVLAKSATTTRLFKKFPQHFELMPAGKPNQVRLKTD